MYASTALRSPFPRGYRSAPTRPAARSAATAQRTSTCGRPRGRRRRRPLLEELDSGGRTVAVAEDELDEPLAGREVRRPRPRAEREAVLLERALQHERRERPGGHR